MSDMPWQVLFHPEFQPEFERLPADIQDELLARLRVLAQFGPSLGRPHVDTLEGSKFKNMKELRFQLDGVWRFAFAFDPQRNAIVFCGGDKEDRNSKKFYRQLIETADRRFTAHIASLRKAAKE
jgi:transcriptional regulator with XRE-family HTH domain